MRLLQFFYTPDSDACQRAKHVLEELVSEEDDIVLVAHDITTEAGQVQAEQFEISTVPTTIVDGNRVIRGVPQGTGQVLGD